MRSVRRSAAAFTLMTALAFGLAGSVASAAGAGARPAAAGPTPGGTLAIQASPSTLDPGTTATQQSSAPIFSLIYGQLYRDNPKGVLSDDIALGYDLSPDGLTVTIPIRHGVFFQDGTQLNAAAVAFNLKRDENGDSSGTCPCSTFLAPIASVTAHGLYTVVIKLKHRDVLLHDILAESDATYMVSPTALQRLGEAAFGNSPVGAGPFRVTAFVPGTSGTLTKFTKSYETKTVYLQSITWTKISVDSSWIAACQSQTVDVCSFSEANISGDVGSIASSVPSVLHEIDSPRVYWTRIQFNVYSAPFNNQIAREAIQEATDPSQLLSIVAGKPSVTCGLIASGNEFYWGSTCPKGVPSYNPTGAAALVAQLPGGKLNFSVLSIDNTSVYSQVLPALVAEWNKIPGINASASIVSHGTEVADQANGSYQMIAPGPGGGFIDPVLGAQPYIGAGSPQNAYGYKSSKLDALLTDMEVAKSPAQEAKDWLAYNTLDLQEEGDIGLYQGTTQNWINNAVSNIMFSGFDVYYDHAWCKAGVC